MKVPSETERSHPKQVDAVRRLRLAQEYVRRLRRRLHAERYRRQLRRLRGTGSKPMTPEALNQRTLRGMGGRASLVPFRCWPVNVCDGKAPVSTRELYQ